MTRQADHANGFNKRVYASRRRRTVVGFVCIILAADLKGTQEQAEVAAANSR